MARLIYPPFMVAFLIIVSAPYIESCKKKTGGTTRSVGPPEIWVQVSEVGKMKIKEGQQVMQAIDKIHNIKFRGEDVLIYDDHSIKIPSAIYICYSLKEEVEIRYEQKGLNRTTKVNLRYQPDTNSLDEIVSLINSSICIGRDQNMSVVNVATSVQSLRQIENPLFNECFLQVLHMF